MRYPKLYVVNRKHTKWGEAMLLILVILMLVLTACSDDLATSKPTVQAAAVTATANGKQSTTAPSTPSVAPTAGPEWTQRWLRPNAGCRPPCWEGLTPGKTTVPEAVDLLKKNPLIEAVQEPEEIGGGYSRITWNWTGDSKLPNAREGRGGQFIFLSAGSNQTIELIRPSLDSLFKLGDVIQAYGEPTHIVATLGHAIDQNEGYFDITFVYVNSGFSIGNSFYTANGLNKPVLDNNLLLSPPDFFVPGDIGKARLSEPAQTWQGFKGWDFYCRAAHSNGQDKCDTVKFN